MGDPIHQFHIIPLFTLGHIGPYEIAFTNSAAFMLGAVALIALLMLGPTSGRALVPGRLQSMAEMTYEFVASTVRSTAGSEGMKFFPFVFTLFMFILTVNMIGLIPYTFTVTSHIIVTFAMAGVVFLGVTIIGIARHGFHFLSFFVPHGVPAVLLLLLVPIEVLSYFIRPFTLSIRLFANMMAGHTMLAIFAGFVTAMGIFGIIPLGVDVLLIFLELLVAVLQAYVFTILTCLYLRDAIHLH